MGISFLSPLLPWLLRASSGALVSKKKKKSKESLPVMPCNIAIFLPDCSMFQDSLDPL